jgi:hypothetical protein
MKKALLFLLISVVSYSYSQSVNDYKAVIVPVKYDFLKTENQYRLTTMSKFNLNKAGFQAFYNNEAIPSEYSDRCSLLYMDVVKENAFLATKLFVTLKDCYGKIIFQSEVGKSKEKEYETAYGEALNGAFESVNELKYKFTGATNPTVQPEVTKLVSTPMAADQKVVSDSAPTEKEVDLLYAQPTATGFQLIDSTPKVVMKVFKTSSDESYIAFRGDVKGVLIAKNNEWFFEYYQNDKLYSEKIAVKF